MSNDSEPAVLLVGAEDAFIPALQGALSRYKVFVEVADASAAVETAVAAAPDLIILTGEAAHDCGNEILSQLSDSPMSSVIPVVILHDNTELDARLRAFRHGAAAIIPRSASVDAIATEIARLAREIPTRGGEALGVIGEATLTEFVNALSKQLRSGILSVSAGDGTDQEAVRLVLGGGRPLAELIDDFVRRARRHVVLAEPLKYEFDERAGGTVQLLDSDVDSFQATPADIQNVRLVLADDDAARADHIAQELRTRGASVVVTDLSPSDTRFDRMRQVDPTLLLLGEEHVQGSGYQLIRRMRRDMRLRWASLLVVRWSEIWSEQSTVSAAERLASTLASLAEPERGIMELASSAARFDTRLESIGPARVLRALASSSHSIRVLVHNPRLRVQIDLSDGLVVGATASILEPDPRDLEGSTALSAFLQLSSGRVQVTPVQSPKTANIMATVDVALSMADAEPPPIQPSLPAEHLSTNPPPRPDRVGNTQTLPTPFSEASEIPTAAPLAGANHTASGPASSALAAPPELSTIAGPKRSASFRRELSSQIQSARASLYEVLSPIKDLRHQLPIKRALTPTVSQKSALLLLGLAILQGLVFAVGFRLLDLIGQDEPQATQETLARAATPSPSAVAPSKVPSNSEGLTAASVARSPNAEPPTAKKPPKPEPKTASSSLPPGVKLAAGELPLVDGSGKKAPSCATLVPNDALQEGVYPGAAYEQTRLANRMLVRGDVKGAHVAYCKAARWDADNAGILLGLGHLLLLRRDGEAALEWVRKGLALQPDSRRAKGLLGDALARTGDYETARRAFLEEGRFSPNDTAMLPTLAQGELVHGQRMMVRRDYGQAERHYRRACILDPKLVAAPIGLSRALIELGDNDAAVLWGKRAVHLSPRNAEARVALGNALAAAGDVEAARVEWKEARLLDPGNSEAQHRLKAARSTKSQ